MPSENQRTLVFLKPEVIQRGLIGHIISRFENKGLKIIAMKMLKLSTELSKKHYAHIVNKPFYPDLEKYITNHPIIAMVIEGKEAVDVVLNMCGVTNARKANSGTIRGDFSNSTSRNILHRSDSKDVAEKEISNFFRKEELFDYKIINEYYLYANDE